MEKFICNTCGYVYDPAVGDPDAGIAPGTPFESLPDDWVCPLCGVGKDDFEPYNEEQNSSSRLRGRLLCCRHSPTLFRNSLAVSFGSHQKGL